MWAAGPAAMPLGPVHLFTDIEGSTRLWEQQPALMRSALAQHDALARATVQAQAGRVVKTTGDGLHAVFDQAAHALAAALSLLQQLADPAHTAGLPLALRCGLHLGADEARDDDFFGPDVNRAARVMAAAHGGQLLVSEAVALALAGQLPLGVGLRALGPVHLRDLAQPERLYQVLAPPLRTDFPPPRGLASVPHNLPQPLNRFIGRGDALAQVAGLCAEHRLVTLWGPGGMGKSRLSLQLGRELLDRFTDGVWLVELAPVQAADRVPQAVADALGVQEAPGQPLAEALARHLRERQLLLILDNCEHLRPAAAALAKQLLQGAPGLHILASSRELLHMAGECAYPVPALGLPQVEAPIPADTGALMQHEAVRLFVDRARLVQASFALGPDNAAAVLDICRRLDGIPLALELAAARVRAMSVHTMAPRLAESFRLVATQDETVAPRQRTLQHLIDWSWQLLGDDERRLLARLTLFAAGFTLEAAEAVCADAQLPADAVLDLLAQLVDKSLVVLDAPDQRYRLLSVLRGQLADRRIPADEAALQIRYVQWHADLAEPLAQGQAAAARADGPGAGFRVEPVLPDLLQAHALALAWPPPDADTGLQLALRIAVALRLHFFERGALSVGLQVLRATAARAQALAPRAAAGDTGLPPPALVQAQLLFYIGHLCNLLGQPEDARTALEDSLAMVRQLGEAGHEAAVLQPLGAAYAALHDMAQARACFERAIEVSQLHGLPQQLMSAQVRLAQWQLAEGAWSEARDLFNQARLLAQQQGLGTDQATIELNLGLLALREGALAVAQQHTQHALQGIGTDGPARLTLALLDLGCALALANGRHALADTLMQAAKQLCHRTGLARDPVDQRLLAPWLAQLWAAAEGPSGAGPEPALGPIEAVAAPLPGGSADPAQAQAQALSALAQWLAEPGPEQIKSR